MALNPYKKDRYVDQLRRVRRYYQKKLDSKQPLTFEEEQFYLLLSCLNDLLS